MEPLVADHPLVAAYHDTLAGLLSNLAVVRRNQGQRALARRLLERAVAHHWAAVKRSPGEPRYREELAHHHNYLSAVLADLGKEAMADEAHEQATRLWEGLHADFPARTDYRRFLAHALLVRAAGLTAAGQQKLAERTCRRAVDHCRALVAAVPNEAAYRNQLGGALNDLALRLARRKAWPEARRLALEAVAEQKLALKMQSDHPTARLFLRNHYTVLADVLLAEGDHARAARAAEDMLGVLPREWQTYYRAAGCLQGCAAAAAGDARLAQTYGDRAAELYRETAKRRPGHPFVQNRVAWNLANWPDARLRDPGKAVELAKKAVAASAENAAYWRTLGLAHYRAGNGQAAREAIDRSIELSKGGNGVDLLLLALACWQVKEKEQARTAHRRAVEWAEKNRAALVKDAELREDLRRFRAETEQLIRP
jgi:tetratricopeptide (TPR) repeat protein